MAALAVWVAALLLAAAPCTAQQQQQQPRLVTADDMLQLDSGADPCQQPAGGDASLPSAAGAHDPRRRQRRQLGSKGGRRRKLQQQQQQQRQALGLLQAWSWERYPTYNETAAFLAALATAFPETCTTASIGKSVQGRDLWVVQATRVAASNLTATNSSSSRSGGGMVVLGRPRGQGDLGLWSPPALGSTAWLRMRSAPWFSKPLVALVGNMHGDEDINRQVLLQYALQLCSLGTLGHAAGVAGDSSGGGGGGGGGTAPQVAARISRLLDNTVVQVLPSMNPDSAFLPGTVRRDNARGVDLNRNFWTQDFLGSYDRPTNETQGARSSPASLQFLNSGGGGEAQPETRAVMAWLRQALPRLSANFHGGALVASYLLDACDQLGQVAWCPTPEDPLPRFLALAYALNHRGGMRRGFDNGTTQGAAWYPALGTLQDWVYMALGRRMHVTFELHEAKTLTGLAAAQLAEELPGYYAQNRDALLRFCEMAHLGLRVRLVDADTRAPLAARVTVQQPPALRNSSSSGAWNVPSGGEVSLMAAPGVQYSLRLQPFSVCNTSATYAPVTLRHSAQLGWDAALVGTGLGKLGEVKVMAVRAVTSGGARR